MYDERNFSSDKLICLSMPKFTLSNSKTKEIRFPSFTLCFLESGEKYEDSFLKEKKVLGATCPIVAP